MEVLDTTIANVVLPYIAGGMGISDDEASWVVTTYLVANAVSLTASPFLAKRLGRKTFFLICLGLFSISSLLCAQAWNSVRSFYSVSCKALRAAAWCRCRNRSSPIISACETRAGLRAVRRGGRCRAGGRADARRLAR